MNKKLPQCDVCILGKMLKMDTIAKSSKERDGIEECKDKKIKTTVGYMLGDNKQEPCNNTTKNFPTLPLSSLQPCCNSFKSSITRETSSIFLGAVVDVVEVLLKLEREVALLLQQSTHFECVSRSMYLGVIEKQLDEE
jgi:hypothetical protein